MPNPRKKRPPRGRGSRPKTVRFEDVVRKHQSELYATALRILGERTLAEDALQDAFMKAFKAFAGLRPGSNVRAWLYRILVNTTYDQLDRRKTRLKAMDTLAEDRETVHKGGHTGAGEERDDVRAEVERAVRTLPERYRDALLLRSIQGLSYAEVAAVLAVPENTARSLVHRGKHLLVPKLSHLMKETD